MYMYVVICPKIHCMLLLVMAYQMNGVHLGYTFDMIYLEIILLSL